MTEKRDPLAQRYGRLGLSFRRSFRSRFASRHPRTTDQFRAFLAKVSLPVLIAEFLLIVAVFAAILAVAYELTEEPAETRAFLGWWKELFLYLLSFPTEAALSGDVPANRGTFQVVAAIAGLVLPALFVGAIVLKLFISPDLFTMRNRVAITENAPDDSRFEADGHHLAVRCYSSTQFRLLDVTFSAILRFEHVQADGTTMLLHRQLRVANPHYAIAHPHVPYTLAVLVDEGDWRDDARGRELACLQGYLLGDSAVMIVLISGTIPELTSEFMEAHDFPLARVLSDKPAPGLVVDYTVNASEWQGWENFDES